LPRIWFLILLSRRQLLLMVLLAFLLGLPWLAGLLLLLQCLLLPYHHLLNWTSCWRQLLLLSLNLPQILLLVLVRLRVRYLLSMILLLLRQL
jgi:hypothetical protein